ncbi:fimbrial biogenesis chaperone [Serratia fonticola]|uniref:fimbrial biogenesis chaperone n=1 Tax=Serratia fonticola TaxID=47917 RepID=UPI00217B02B5|nr:molecular chaperone [Serratia fonticola]CAI1547332.1 Chaperone protein papD precursor [Serratia fonticola]
MKQVFYWGSALIFATLTCAPAMAGISVDNSRIIFQASDDAKGKSTGITSSASSSSPFLVRTQVTKDAHGQQIQTPFVTTPSLLRLDPGNTNQVLIMKTPSNLPKDRESLFYLRVVAMPAGTAESDTTSSAVAGSLQVATGQVVKLFYRPDNLPMVQKEAMGKLQFSSSPQGLAVSNPTPYYISLSRVTVGGKEVKLKIGEGSSMLAPFGSAVWPGAPRQGRVEWSAINDFGGAEVFHGSVR